jgi:hypothetical protein
MLGFMLTFIAADDCLIDLGPSFRNPDLSGDSVTDVKISRLPAKQAPSPQKTLTDDDRRRICRYHEENPAVKQMEIAGKHAFLPEILFFFFNSNAMHISNIRRRKKVSG